MKKPTKLADSAAVTAEVASSGNLHFYWNTLKSNPKKIIVGVWETFCEVTRWVLWPRFSVRAGPLKRIGLLIRFVRAELNIPGGTTTLEAIWIAYGAHIATSDAPTWVQVGCFKGLSAARLSLIAQLLGKKLRVYDTFEGLPGSDAIYEAVDGGVDYEFKVGSYLGTEEEVRRNIKAYGCSEHVTLIQGDVKDTLPDKCIDRISFGYMDVDLVESYKSCFKGLASAIGSGTVIGIHEACYRPIRSLIEDHRFWSGIGCGTPSIIYVAEAHRIRSCRNVAFLKW